MAKQTRVQQAREKKVRCEVEQLAGNRCTSNGDHTYGGRLLTFVDPDGDFLRTLLDPGAVDVTRRLDRRVAR